MNKIQKGKAGLIGFGIILLVLTVICVAGGIACVVNFDNHWWMIVISILLFLLGLFGLIISITFIWTGCAMKATKGNLMEGNIPLENGTINATRCPHCGASVKQDDAFCRQLFLLVSVEPACPASATDGQQES